MVAQYSSNVNLEAMKVFENRSRACWLPEEDELLLNHVNRCCNSTGRVSWKKSKTIPGRSKQGMQTRWKTIAPNYIWNGKKYKDPKTYKISNESDFKNKADQVREFLNLYPDADNHTAANFLNCSYEYVRRIRYQNKPDEVTPQPRVDNARKTPQNASTGVSSKRVVVKKSFLWGAFTFERYE